MKYSLSSFSELKKKLNFTVYDTHVHPHDVMGIISNPFGDSVSPKAPLQTPLPEKMKFGIFANFLLEGAFRFQPSVIKKSIKAIYGDTSVDFLLREMDDASIDKAVIIPVSPWLNPEEMDSYVGERFINLGSVDIHSMSREDIIASLSRQLIEKDIKGIKLHPNLQGFMPQPKDNAADIQDKLTAIYDFAQNKKLYLLFHGGYTRFTNKKLLERNESAASYRRGSNAMLKNFYNIDGSSEIFDNYTIPIIIAHLGNYALIKPDYYSLDFIGKKYPHVLFDTAGISPKLISRGLTILGNKKLVFGSDTLYNKEYSSVLLCSEAIYNSDLDFEETIVNVFSKNYEIVLNSLR